MIERNIRIFTAVDGKEFKDEDECKRYERAKLQETIDEMKQSTDLIFYSDRDIQNITLPKHITDILHTLKVSLVYYIKNKRGLDLLNKFFMLADMYQGYSDHVIQEDENAIMGGIRVVIVDDSYNTYQINYTIEDFITNLISMKESFYNKMEESHHEE